MNDCLILDDLKIFPDFFLVTRGNKTIVLSPKEYELLNYLMVNKNKIVLKDKITKCLNWGKYLYEGTIDVYINFLRNKIDKNFSYPLLRTRRGFGYGLISKAYNSKVEEVAIKIKHTLPKYPSMPSLSANWDKPIEYKVDKKRVCFNPYCLNHTVLCDTKTMVEYSGELFCDDDCVEEFKTNS